VSGPTASACCVVPSAVALDGSGMQRTMFGLKSIPKCKKDGYMSTPVRKHGTSRGCMLKDGARKCHTVSLSRLTVQPMSPDDMCENHSTQNLGTGARRKYYSTL